HEERKEGERDDRDKTEAGERPAGEDRGAARVPPGERGGGDRARDDADGLRADEDADAELAEAERATEEVEVEGGHAEAEDADRARWQPELRRLPWREQRVLDADEAADDLPVPDELVGDLSHGVARDREPEAGRVARDERVHADDLTGRRPDERPARVPLVDRRVRLQEIVGGAGA